MARQPAPIGVPTPTCSELACWVRRPHRVTVAAPIPRVIAESVDVHPCAELACCVPRPPRVAIVGGCVCYRPYCTDSGFQAGGRIGGESNAS